MARERWLSIKVELLSGRDLVLEHPPGRVMIVSPAHTLAELAEAIDVAFARWERSHLHEFRIGDDKRYMLGGSDFEPEVIDSTGVTLASLHLDVGMSFEYVFDSVTTGGIAARCSRSMPIPKRNTALLPTRTCRSGAGAGFRISTAASARTSNSSASVAIAVERPGTSRLHAARISPPEHVALADRDDESLPVQVRRRPARDSA